MHKGREYEDSRTTKIIQLTSKKKKKLNEKPYEVQISCTVL
uniref:ORF40w n=1 Tax=Pinus koraiensis TaxID=88728 RepID=A4QMF3_PINKO|nr:ORF40w [Pinus koraiensis]ABP35490.1 ORF40w [Pinus koraiensis]